MPIGKDSITKRVAKAATEEKNIAPELVATVAAAPKAPAKKPTSSAKKPATSTAKKTPAKKPATKKEALTPPTEAPSSPLVDTSVLANVSPETVAAVIGHKENTPFEKVQLGEPMPVHLL